MVAFWLLAVTMRGLARNCASASSFKNCMAIDICGTERMAIWPVASCPRWVMLFKKFVLLPLPKAKGPIGVVVLPPDVVEVAEDAPVELTEAEELVELPTVAP